MALVEHKNAKINLALLRKAARVGIVCWASFVRGVSAPKRASLALTLPEANGYAPSYLLSHQFFDRNMHGFDSVVMQPKFSVSCGTENSLRFERNIPLVLVWMTDGSGQFILAISTQCPSAVSYKKYRHSW
jgi:hypothetical protein